MTVYAGDTLPTLSPVQRMLHAFIKERTEHILPAEGNATDAHWDAWFRQTAAAEAEFWKARRQ